MQTGFPNRVLTAYCLIAYAWLQLLRWVFLAWMTVDDSRFAISEAGGFLLLSGLVTAAYLAAMVTAGKWILKVDSRGHYLAAGVLGVTTLLSLSTAPSGETLFSAAFLVLLVKDILRLRADADFSLATDSYQLADFWPAPWLASVLVVALVGHGYGAVPAGLVHLLSPLAILFIHLRLRKHAAVLRSERTARYYWSVAAWALFYIVSTTLGLVALSGLGGLAMQGGGN